MNIIQRVVDIILTAAGYYFGQKRADLEHEKAHHESLMEYEKTTKKKMEEVGRQYDALLRDYNTHINGMSEARDLQTKNDQT